MLLLCLLLFFLLLCLLLLSMMLHMLRLLLLLLLLDGTEVDHSLIEKRVFELLENCYSLRIFILVVMKEAVGKHVDKPLDI